MQAATERRNDVLDRRWQRALMGALVASVVLHATALLLFRTGIPLPDVPNSAAGPRAGDPRPAAGGGMEAIALRIEVPPPEPEVIPVPAEPVPVPDAEVVPEDETRPTPAPLGQDVAAGAGTGQGESTGPGRDSGTGQGDGGTGDEGLYRVTPPTPRGLILPPSDRPGRVRGREVVVYVFVTDRGRVVSDSTRLAPTTGDSRFDDRLRRQAAEWVFNPARRGGQPISEWFAYTIVL